LKFDHPAYSQDLAPSDFHLLEPLQVAFRGHQFADDDEVKEEVHDKLSTQPKQFLLMTRALFSPHCDKVTVLASFILRILMVGGLCTWTNITTMTNATGLHSIELLQTLIIRLCDTFTSACISIFKVVSVCHNSKYRMIQHPKLCHFLWTFKTMEP
jgi:hypothetical protein